MTQLSCFVWGQKPNYKFKSLKQSDGLINRTVYDIFQDSYGFIWIGTQQGMQRFDGVTFKDFKYSEEDTVGLWHNFVTSFSEDSAKNVWITTPGGINKYIRKTDRLERVNVSAEVIEKNRNREIKQVCFMINFLVNKNFGL